MVLFHDNATNFTGSNSYRQFHVMRHSLVLLISFIIVSCSENSRHGKSVTNPNGSSELALLMRAMFDESDSLKQLVLEGKQLSGLRRYEEIHTAVPTDSEVTGPVFEAFAKNYIESIKVLEESDSLNVFNFNNMVDQCMNCHTEFCPGPKKRIKQLYIR